MSGPIYDNEDVEASLIYENNKKARQTTPRLSLFQIAGELLGLIYQRQDAEDRLAAVPETVHWHNECAPIRQEIAACDGLIKHYVEGHLATKSDSYAFIIKEFKAREKARKQAADELRKEADKDKAAYERLQQTIISVMQELGLPEINGNVHRITRQGNGGVGALTIAQPDLVPLEFKRVTVELRADVCRQFAEQFTGQYRILEIVHPDSKDIREALERGEHVMGARLEDRAEHIRIR